MIASQHPQDVKMPFTSPSDQSADTPGVPSKEIPVSDPVSENATSNQTLLLGTLHVAMMCIKADSFSRASRFSAAAADRARIQGFHG